MPLSQSCILIRKSMCSYKYLISQKEQANKYKIFKHKLIHLSVVQAIYTIILAIYAEFHVAFLNMNKATVMYER